VEKLARSVAKEEKIRVKLIFSTHLLERISQVASTGTAEGDGAGVYRRIVEQS